MRGPDPLIQRSLRLTQATVVGNGIVGVFVVYAGLWSGLVSVLAIGAFWFIAAMSTTLVWVHLARLGDPKPVEVEHPRAHKIVALTQFLLACCIAFDGVRSVIGMESPTSRTLAILLLNLALIPLLTGWVIVLGRLAQAKRRIASELSDDRHLLRDAALTGLCQLLGISTVLGLGLFVITGAGWLDPTAGFIVAILAVRQGVQAWTGDLGGVDAAAPADSGSPTHR